MSRARNHRATLRFRSRTSSSPGSGTGGIPVTVGGPAPRRGPRSRWQPRPTCTMLDRSIWGTSGGRLATDGGADEPPESLEGADQNAPRHPVALASVRSASAGPLRNEPPARFDSPCVSTANRGSLSQRCCATLVVGLPCPSGAIAFGHPRYVLIGALGTRSAARPPHACRRHRVAPRGCRDDESPHRLAGPASTPSRSDGTQTPGVR